MRINFVRKENNNNIVYLTILLPELRSSGILESTPERNQHNQQCLHSVDSAHMRIINYVVIVFFAHKKYSRSFIKLRLNPWCHMDCFTDVLATFLCIDCGSILAVYGGSDSSQIPSKYLNLCSEDERRSYGFGTTWGWVINERIFIFGWTIPLTQHTLKAIHNYCTFWWIDD